MESVAKIRNMYYVKGLKIKQISRKLNIARNTVKRVLKTKDPKIIYKRDKEIACKLGPYVEDLKKLLEDNKLEPVKRRYTAKRLYEILKERGYIGAYDSVQRYVKSWWEKGGTLRVKGYIPLYFAPGECYQFDWSQEIVTLGGVDQRVHVAHIRLCYSRLFLVVAYPRESQEMLFDAHRRAFQFFGGNPTRGIYDNLKTGIDSIGKGKERKFNSRFLTMLSHYLIDPTACTPAAGWEKGQVENQVGNVREWFFIPKLSFKDFEELNKYLLDNCLKLAQNRKHPDQPERTIYEVFTAEEKDKLQLIIPVFDGYIEKEVSVSSTCLIKFDYNRYSVDCRYAKRSVSLRYYADTILVVADGEKIGSHLRCFGKNKIIYDPWHYVPLLERKPGALRNGAPFKDWRLSEALERVKTHLMLRLGGDREFVSILQSIQTDGLEAVDVACELALSEKAISADYILNALSRLRVSRAPVVVATPDQLRLHNEPISDCKRYNHLLKEEANARV